MKPNISKNTEMVVSNGMSDFEIKATLMATTNVKNLKKVISLVAWEIQKLRERVFSSLEIVDHLLERDGLTKPTTPKNSVKENRVKFTRQVRSQDELNTIYLYLRKMHGQKTRQSAYLLWGAPTLKDKWFFAYVINVRLHLNLQKVNLFHKTYRY